MKSSIVILLVIVAILVIGGVFYIAIGSNPSSKNIEGTGTQNSGNEIDSNTPSETNTNTPKTYNTEIKNFAFNPITLTIKKGDSVKWTNIDSAKHTVTSDSGNELDSELLTNGETYSHTFNEVGTYNYHCAPHPMMKAKIIVQ
ncbi:MAG: cupredoxin family copper-binding protein [Candidatus Pacearchaeota archaeon]